jgi:hypothetical protein
VRPGFATEIGGINQPPTPPTRIDPARLSAITDQLNGPTRAPAQESGDTPASGPAAEPPAGAPPPPRAGVARLRDDGAAVLEQSGDSLAEGLVGVRTIGTLARTLRRGRRVTFKAAQFLPPPGALTTYEQLRSISSGVANFGSQTRPITGSGTGNYTISYSYNFGTQSASGNVSITTTSGFTNIGTGSFALLANPFATGTGPVVITESNVVVSPLGGLATITYKFRNSDNVIFKALAHQIDYTDGVTGTGGGVLAR